MDTIVCKHRALKTIASVVAQPLPPLLFVIVGIALPFYTPNKIPGIIFGFLFLCLAAGFFYRFVLPNFQWVRIDGNCIQAQNFYTRRVYDRDVSEIEGIVAYGAVMNTAANRLADDVIGSVRGYQIKFKDGLVIPIGRMEMTGADELALHMVNHCGVTFTMGGNVQSS